MNTQRTASLLVIVAGLMLGGCASFQPSPVVLKNQVEPVMRTQGAEMSADRYYQAGRSAMRSGDLRGARKFFSLALLQDPNYIDAINAMAAILTVQGRYADSLELMRQAVERAPDNAMFRRNLERVERMVARERAQPLASGPQANPAPAGSVGDSTEPAVVEPAREAPATAAGTALAQGEPASELDVAPVVVALAPNVYQLQLPDYRAAGAPARQQPNPRASRQQPVPAVALSAPWVRASGKQSASPPADEAASRVPPAGGVQTVSYRKQAEAPSRARVMVTNGMGREGWAARHAGLLGAMGMTPTRITNYRHFGVEQTLIRYREGMLSEAERISGAVATLGNARLVADDSLPAGIDMQVILGQDSQPARHGPTT
jgi:hypothetical protein